MTREDAVKLVEELFRNDPAVQEAVAEFVARGHSYLDVARIALRVQERIEKEVP